MPQAAAGAVLETYNSEKTKSEVFTDFRIRDGKIKECACPDQRFGF